MSPLFTPFQLRGLNTPNRVVVSPMCQYWAENGLANAWHMSHLGGLANSGAGVLIVEATAVLPEGRITPGCLGLWDDATESALKPITEGIRQFSSTALVLQLNHAGRKASSHTPWNGGQLIDPADGGWETFAPSPVAHQSGETPPTALDSAAMKRVIQAFKDSAVRGQRLGFDGLELHAAHGYLLHEFLSPLSNLRTDEYGGSLENRMRFPLEVFDAVRSVFPADKPIGVKVSAIDWVEGGLDLEQTIAFCAALKERNVDWISVSSGGVSPLQKITIAPGYQVPFAHAIKEATGVTTIAVGLITEARQAEQIVASDQSDFVALARAMLYDPRWGWHAAAELGATVDAAPPYWRATPHGVAGLFNRTNFGAR